MDGLVFELLAEGGAMAGSLAEELALHALFILEDELGAAVLGQIDAAVHGLEVTGIEHAVGEQIEGEGLGEYGAERLHQVQSERPAAVFGGVQQAEGGIEAVGVEEGVGFAVDEGGGK